MLDSAPKALQLDVGFTWRKASYTFLSAVEVEFSISVWMGGLALFPPALP